MPEIRMTYFCRRTRKLASPWVPSTKSQWVFSLDLGLLQKISSVFMIHFVKQDNLHQWTRLLWFLKHKCNCQKFFRTRKASHFTCGVFTDVFYVIDQNVAVSKACVNHRPYFLHRTKNPFKKPVDFKTREPEVQNANGFRGFRTHSCTTLLVISLAHGPRLTVGMMHTYTHSLSSPPTAAADA